MEKVCRKEVKADVHVREVRAVGAVRVRGVFMRDDGAPRTETIFVECLSPIYGMSALDPPDRPIY